jgi:hypothetical protein
MIKIFKSNEYILEFCELNRRLLNLFIQEMESDPTALAESGFKEIPLIYSDSNTFINTFDIFHCHGIIIDNMEIGYRFCVDELGNESRLYGELIKEKKNLDMILSHCI